MNKEQATQQQIDECMDSFDFSFCCAVLSLIKKTGRGYPVDWYLDGGFYEPTLRREARQLLWRVARGDEESGMASYLRATKTEGVDEESGKPWILLSLSFVVADNITQDGIEYDE
jgi:hypothetical protein